MEVLVRQRFQFAKISPHKNYCKLNDGPKSVEIQNIDSVTPELKIEELDSYVPHEPVCGSTITTSFVSFDELFGAVEVEEYVRLSEKKYQRSVYFHTEDGENINVQKCAWGGKTVFYTTKDRHIKKHYGNPFSTVHIETLERKITKNGDNLTFKLYRHVKYRNINWKFFKKSSNTISVTFNLRTGDITTIECEHGKRGMTRFRKNSFINLQQALHGRGIMSIFAPYEAIPKDHKLREDLMEALNFEEYSKVLHTFFDIGYDVNTFQQRLFNAMVKKFVEVKKIKVHDHYEPLLVNWYPTKKYLKRNSNKLIAAILDKVGLKSKYAIKLLHQYPGINFPFFIKICKLFKEDWVKYVPSINKDFFNTSTFRTSTSLFSDPIDKKIPHNLYVLTDNEKSKLVKLCNEHFKENHPLKTREDITVELYDHFAMLFRVKIYYPEWEFKGQTIELFRQEHSELSKIERLIKKGTSIIYTFNQEMVDSIEEPIIVTCPESTTPITLYPVILKREEEYIEEGSHMHHCVASYANNDTSIIISLRQESKFGDERVTSEYKTQNGQRVQSRYFCNDAPPEIFHSGLIVLENRVQFWKTKNKLKSIEKTVVPLIINGLEIKPQESINFIEDILAGAHRGARQPLPF
jgi:hypothetical protein